MTYNKARYGHQIVSYGANHNKNCCITFSPSNSHIPLISVRPERGFMTRGRRTKSVSSSNNIVSNYKHQVYTLMKEDPRFRRVHYKYYTILFNFKYVHPRTKKEYWKGASATFSKNRITVNIYVSPNKTRRVRFKYPTYMQFNPNKPPEQFLDALYKTLTAHYTYALSEGFHE